MSFFDKLKQGLTKTRENFTHKLEDLISSHNNISDDLLEELEESLIIADVGVATTEQIMRLIREAINRKDISTPGDLKPFIKQQIISILDSHSTALKMISNGLTVILVVGVNGAGKTTTIGKLSAYYKSIGKTVMLAAADTFRAAAIEQLELWSIKSGAQILKHKENADPAAVVFDAINSAKARKYDILIIDTAGRLQNKSNLMQELEKIYRVIKKEIPNAPHETLLVLDANTGQNAISQAQLFTQAASVTGIVLTKLDGTAKGGVVLALTSQLSIPVKCVGIGEGIDDLRPFVPKDFVRALFLDD